MDLSLGANLSVEVTKALPQLFNLIWAFRKTGSDIVVEDDLSRAFGKVSIESFIDKSFREITKVSATSALLPESQIILQYGPGPTLIRAYQDPSHFASVIQLSLLGWFHDHDSLASALVTALTARPDRGEDGSNYVPRQEDIRGTIEACTRQTSSFFWNDYSDRVDSRLRAAFPDYRYSADHVRLTTALLRGAIDFLHRVQKFPDSSTIVVSNPMGCIVLIIWAHYVLGLVVEVQSSSNKTASFGGAEKPHLIIIWSKISDPSSGDWIGAHRQVNQPEIRLLDQDMKVQLLESPDLPSFNLIDPDDRHPLLDYGSKYLYRSLNAEVLIEDDDPVYAETVKMVVALAVHASERMERDMTTTDTAGDYLSPPDSPQRRINLAPWRILQTARIMFSQHLKAIEPKFVKQYTGRFSETPFLNGFELPMSCTAYMKKIPPKEYNRSPFTDYSSIVQYMSSLLLLLSHIKEVENCIHVPLRMSFHLRPFNFLDDLCQSNERVIKVKSSEVFETLSSILVPKLPYKETAFLYCHFGWSMYMDTFGDKDPTQISPELVRIQRGVPTDIRTGQQKVIICDRRSYGLNSDVTLDNATNNPVYRGCTYTPRAAATITHERERWAPEQDCFTYCVDTRIIPTAEWRDSGNVEPFNTFFMCREMQEILWQTYTTVPCGHPPMHERDLESINLTPDALTLLGCSNWAETKNPFPEPVVIMLTRGQPALRWLAIRSASETARNVQVMKEKYTRETMIRTDNCCDNCALEQTATKRGRWILIL